MPDSGSEPRILKIAVVGPMPPMLLGRPGVDLSPAPGTFQAVVVTEATDASGLQARLPLLPLHCPIADFGGNAWLASDEKADPARDGEAAQRAFEALRELAFRCRDLPNYAASADRFELELLAFAHTRADALKAQFTSAYAETVEYAALRGRVSLRPVMLRKRLEQLAELDLLNRRFFARALSCPHCGSARLAARESCTECDSSDLHEESLVHHFRCGYQGAESKFLGGDGFVCPKCRRELRHFGVDYSKPGIVSSCGQCGHVMSEPRPRFSCLDCQKSFDGEEAETTNWYSYALTDAGRDAVLTGRIPHTDFAAISQPYHRAFSFRDFLVAATELLRIARRYKRPFVLALCHVANDAELKAQLGQAGLAGTYRLVVDILAETLRESDFFAATHAHGFVVALPETDVVHVSTVFARIRARLDEAAAMHVELATDVRDGDGAAALLAELRP